MEKGMILQITGSPRSGKDIFLFERRVRQKVLGISRDVQGETFNFAQINFRFKWTVKVFDINRVDLLRKQIKRLIDEFIVGWELQFNIKYIEKEVT